MTADPTAVDGRKEPLRFAKLGFEHFKAMAQDASLSEHEKIGFPDAFREGFDEAIWNDIRAKLPALNETGTRILEIGPGCGALPRRLIANAEALGQSVVLVDHKEMLDQLPFSAVVRRVEGEFPRVADAVRPGPFDAILAYSVLQVVAIDADIHAFIEAARSLLAPGGRLLAGDIPNPSRLRRFLASDAGAAYHRAYMKADAPPDLSKVTMSGGIDDALLLDLTARARAGGFDAYLVPQPPELPLANRREDLLIVRP